MKKFVLFDLDGTLLEINFDKFIDAYFQLLLPYLSKRIRGDVKRFVLEATNYMIEKIDERTNMEKFLFKFTELSGVDKELVYESFSNFYKLEFPKLSFLGKPREGAKETILMLKEKGIGIILATNAIFPLLAIEERVKWAGLTPSMFNLITHMENMHAAKPHKEYYVEILEKLKVTPQDVIMIGDDIERDIVPAKSIGIESYRIGKDIKNLDELLEKNYLKM